jgi:hypothetical protein
MGGSFDCVTRPFAAQGKSAKMRREEKAGRFAQDDNFLLWRENPRAQSLRGSGQARVTVPARWRLGMRKLNWRKPRVGIGRMADLKIGQYSLMAMTLVFAVAGSEWKRMANAPIVAPRGKGWESAGTFNPATIERNGKTVLIYRAQDAAGTSRLGYAESSDGIHFERRPAPVLSPETDYEKDGGVEDPRIVGIDGVYYMTYTGYNKRDAQLCMATSGDLLHWKREGILLPAIRETGM